MGCGISRALSIVGEGDSTTSLDEVESGYLHSKEVDTHSKPLKKQLEHGYNTHKALQIAKTGQGLVSMCWVYLSTNTYSDSAFQELLELYPEVADLFSSSSVMNRHTRMTCKMLSTCISFIVQGRLADMVLALHSLGCFHAQKGVTIDHMLAFEEIVAKAILEANGAVAYNFTPHQKSGMIRDVLQVITDTMVVGMQRHEDVMTYVRVVIEKKDDCWWNRKMEKRLHMSMARTSWRKMAQHLDKL